MLPSISVITPSYNQGQFIGQTVASVLDQHYPGLDYIVVDGLSTDSTATVLAGFGEQFRLIRERDRGQTDALNKGLRAATGEIVCWLNSDDYFLPGTLATVGRYFADHPDALWLTGDCLIVNADGHRIQEPIRQYKRLLRSLGPLAGLGLTNAICQPATFWRRAVHDQTGLLDESLHYTMDYDFWLRLNRLQPPRRLDQPLAAFRIHGDSKGGSRYVAQFREDAQTARHYWKNRPVTWLHQAHNQLIMAAYRLLK